MGGHDAGDTAPREFHVSRQARDRYQFDESLATTSGNVVLVDFEAARIFAHKMNQQRDLARHPDQAAQPGQINALGLLDEILHFVAGQYRRQHNPRLLAEALDWLEARLGSEAVEASLAAFTDEFPPLAVYRREISASAYLRGESEGTPHREIALEEMLMLWLTNMNPACAPFRELFDDTRLAKTTAYLRIISGLRDFCATQPSVGPEQQNLIDLLRSPAFAAPDSLSAQLEFCRQRWGIFLGEYLVRLLRSLDLISEEVQAHFAGPGPAQVPVYDLLSPEQAPERYSLDLDWMPRLILMAKHTYVWLDQLSKQYGCPISRLDQVPDEELDILAHWGFTGLWLIGLWERSPASRRIKQMTGNPEAVASAYSVFDYEIAADLGGEAAYQNLRERAWRRGIRLASDMVPNHMAIDSRWVIEHPDWFISLDHSPFPSYTFQGPDLSWDERVGIFLEDHYYDRTDAAVVFKRVDRYTGSEKYIYHGNDGTHTPWNDTAQLNYLLPAVREAVIQHILHVARQFPVVRFDAAMTLAKQHYQRLWFPAPGTGGAIPSRAERGLTKAQFDALLPEEFWREVVDRVAAEAPDTLLLAEAFWLLEGYFVRTLGMHRVYNSAFMNMLRDEENAKYRQVMKNTLEFDPEILKRYVNFMNNPDEDTAVEQFGGGDKYFGICTLMATLPGLPMFGHGQIQGLVEKYGMEYQRAYYDEQPDPELVRRHEREIVPLLLRRHLFAGVENFFLYDFFTTGESVDENVFAFSNRVGDERALVVYNNCYAAAAGWVRDSVAYAVKTGPEGERVLAQRKLSEGLGQNAGGGWFTVFRDQIDGLEYIRESRELSEKGLYVEVGAYQRHVFLDFRQVQDSEQRLYSRLAAELDGRGVPSIEQSLQEAFLRPILVPFRELVNPDRFHSLFAARTTRPDGQVEAALLDDVEERMAHLLHAVREFSQGSGDELALARQTRERLETFLRLPALASQTSLSVAQDYPEAFDHLQSELNDLPTWGALLAWLFVRDLGRVAPGPGGRRLARRWVDDWSLGRVVAATLGELGADETTAERAVAAIRLLSGDDRWRQARAPERAYSTLLAWLQDGEVQRFLKLNRFDRKVWFNKESFEDLVGWTFLIAVVEAASASGRTASRLGEEIVARYRVVVRLRQAEEVSQYQLQSLVESARRMDARPRPARSPG